MMGLMVFCPLVNNQVLNLETLMRNLFAMKSRCVLVCVKGIISIILPDRVFYRILYPIFFRYLKTDQFLFCLVAIGT